MEAIKANKAALNKLISWNSSRYNESKKSDVIADIIFRVEKGEDCTVEYRAGVYSEGAHTGRYKSKWTGGAYTLEIKNGLATIRNEVSDVVVPNKEVLQLEKPVRNTYFIPAKTINHDVEKYGVPVGVFQVLNQDLHSFHVLFEGVVRHLAKSDCTVIDRDTVSFSEREDKHMAQDIDINRLPIAEIATLDYIRNPDRERTGGVYRGSPAFEALLSLAAGNDTAEIYRQYDEAWTAANLKDNFQPKIAILQYAENAGNRDRRFISMETLNDVLHEQPNCNNYELVYVRNAETTTETEAAKDRLNNRLFEEFNADTLRPRNYYGHSLSIGDVIVIVNDFNDRSAYFVDRGTDFIKLPDDFLSREMSAKIYNDLDIRQESILHDNIRRYEAENIVALTDEAMQNRHADISLYYPRIFEMADRRGAIMDMDELGYEPAQIDGFSDDFIMWRANHPERAEERSFEVAQEYEPIPNRYYEPELNIDGTADELFIEARYGYVENPEALKRIAEILKQEGKDEEAERVGYMAEKENEDTSLYSVAQMKLDFMDGQYTGVDDVAISEGLNLSVIYETRDNAVIVSLSRLDAEDDANVLYTGTASMTLEEFKAMNRADFDRFVNEVNAYNMVEQERIEQDERTQEIIIDGHTCSQIDEWQSDNSSYVLGQDIEDGTFYYVRATEGEETFEYEFDSQPSREDVESHHINFLSERDIDRQEAEYGADGSRAFPHLNDEPQERITLHIKYQEPVTMNGWQAETDTITFDSKESMEEFVSGNVAYDYLDNAIRKKDNEILLYAENANGDVIWGTKEEVNHGDNENLQVQSHKTFELVEIDETLPPKDQLKQRLENGIRGVIDSENFKNWLSTGGKLFYNNYSFRNAMLVWLQKPEASYVMGYEKWKDLGRNVGQGATGAKIFIPIMASEKYKGGLFRSIKGNLNEQLSKDPTLTEAVYRLGTSNLEFTMNRANHLVGFKVNGKEQQIFGSDDEAKRFIDRAIIGKVPTGYTVGTVFDAKDVIVPEYLWVRSGFTKEEIATDTKGNPIKNRKGETKIINTPERQARFQTDLDTTIAAKDPVKMQALFDACTAASERKGVPVSLASKENDKTLNDGSKGYFSRQFSEENPNGFIVIDESLEITEKCAVLLHEMGHADLHKNLEALAERMGEDKIPREMREVQAEATAYAVASTFGIETDTSSFNYLAIYARGFELQDFNKSLEVIYKEAQTLTADIKAELDIRGLNLDLTEKPKETLDKETLVTISTKYMDFAAEQGSNIQAALTELPSLVKQNINNPELMEVLKYQKANLDNRRADVEAMLTGIESLNKADTREQQDQFINILDTLMNRISGNSFAFENLSERYVVIAEQARGGLKVDFENDPKKTLEAMKKDYPTLAKLSEPQLQYVATSKFISREFVKLLRNNPQEFVDRVTERATLLPKVAAKNGTFVEVNYCEQWTDKPFFEKGTLCSPKIAETIITGSEAQARGFRQEAERRGEYFPYTKCDMTIFTPSKDGGFISLNTRVEIGDGEQTSLKEHLEKECKRGTERKEILANFQEALTERANKNKIRVQDVHDRPQNAESPANEVIKEGNMTRGEWSERIQDARAQVQEEAQEQAAEKSKNSRDRADE